MKLTRNHFAIAASVVLLALAAPGCKRADNSTDAGATSGASGSMMNSPAATGAMSSGAAAASAASQ